MDISSLLASGSTYQQVAQQLASSQTISSSYEIRNTLEVAYAYSGHETPINQAWADLRNSLNDGDLTSAQSALNSYTQLLPSSNLYMSTLTTPSQTFLSDLNTLKNAINSGDISTAQAVFKTAQYDAPESVANAYSDAYTAGNVEEEAQLEAEAAAGYADYLVSVGYTQQNAAIEANDMMLGGLTENVSDTSTSGASQEKQAEDETTKIVTQDAAVAPTSNQLAATEASAMYKVYYDILSASSSNNDSSSVFAARDAVLNQLASSLGSASSSSNAAAVSSVSVTA